MWNQFMRKLVAWIDPKFAQYRIKSPKPKYTPKTLNEFIEIMRRTPKDVLNDSDRKKIAAVMSFEDRKVGELMVAKSEMVFVNENDFLGPVMLDKLYQSGFTQFPVVDKNYHVKGIIRTDSLNALEIREAKRASKFMDKNICYFHEQDSLREAVEYIADHDTTFFLVLNQKEELVGFITLKIILQYLIG